jgi:hypothetical protein
VASPPEQRRDAFESAQNEVRNEHQKAILLSEVSLLWTTKAASLVQHSLELVKKSRELRKRTAEDAGPSSSPPPVFEQFPLNLSSKYLIAQSEQLKRENRKLRKRARDLLEKRKPPNGS